MVLPSTVIGTTHFCTVPSPSVTTGVVVPIQWIRWSCHMVMPLRAVTLQFSAAPDGPGSFRAYLSVFMREVREAVFSSTVPSAAMRMYGSPS